MAMGSWSLMEIHMRIVRTYGSQVSCDSGRRLACVYMCSVFKLLRFCAMFKFAERLLDISFGQAPSEKNYIRKGKSWIGRTDQVTGEA